jgi:hypothetical protein
MSESGPRADHASPLTAVLRAAVAGTPVAAGPPALQRAVNGCLAGAPGLPPTAFVEVARRGGWHRPGGVVDGHRRRVAAAFEDWLQGELAACGDDLAELAGRHADKRATRIAGTTVYLVADCGCDADEFLQLEVEILQETLGPPIFAEPLADDPAALIDRCLDSAGEPFGEARYALRRLVDVAAATARLRQRLGVPPAALRFIDDWQASSAHAATTLGRHWIMQVGEHLDRFRNPQLQLKPVPAATPLPFPGDAGGRLSGSGLQQALHAYDRRAGYPMAWFFNLVGAHAVPAGLAIAAIEDANAGFRYLPERDLRIVRDWVHRPYAT